VKEHGPVSFTFCGVNGGGRCSTLLIGDQGPSILISNDNFTMGGTELQKDPAKASGIFYLDDAGKLVGGDGCDA